LFCSFWAWFTFDEDCFNILFSPDDEGTLESQTDNTGPILFAWEAGPALICLFVASTLRFVHFLGHWMVPTPTICYTTDEQVDYEKQHLAIQSVQVPYGQVISKEQDDVAAKEVQGRILQDPSFDEDDSGIYIDEHPNRSNFARNRQVIENTVKF
jgi:hypothetical protein